MYMREMDRRRFLAAMGACGLGALAPAAVLAGQEALYLAARKRGQQYQAVVLDAHGRDHLVVPMPDRGHSFAIDAARGRAVAFGRQPGFFAVAFAFDGKGPPKAMAAESGRHFFGHGVFSPDGKLMIATENDYEAGKGVLGLYDASAGGGYRRIGEFDSGGVGPHEVVLLPDGQTLCVANGGILTHPDYGKLALNAHDMHPSLAYIDLHTGDLLEQVALAPQFNRLSIRHMTVDAAGAVWFGCQHTGPAAERPPLVGRHRRGANPDLFAGPPDVLRGMDNYVGSVACDASGTRIATSSPVGNCIVFWDASSGACLGRTSFHDGCGVAPRKDGGFLASNGGGALVAIAWPSGAVPLEHRDRVPVPVTIKPRQTGLSWDNHMRRII